MSGVDDAGPAGGLARLDACAAADAFEALLRCCGARRWAEAMAARRPFGDLARLRAAADEVFRTLGRDDWLEAFRAHPRLGDRDALRARFATSAWAAGEQAGTAAASEATLAALADANRAYEERFGHVFILCATGKPAGEMLAALRARFDNAPDRELEIAAAEQRRITHLRLEKLTSS